MDDAQALRIVSALADGTHPLTGEVFPVDSPYQAGDVVRALYVAVRILESRLQSAPQPPGKSEPIERKPVSSNAGKPWSAEEDKRLLAAFDDNKSLAELAQIHGRTRGGVRARLEKYGRLEPSLATRRPEKSSRSDGLSKVAE